ncbi:hypothetical protein GCM10028807_33620 [Spirosoma daeguense]
MKNVLLLCFLLCVGVGCKESSPSPDGYVKPLWLRVEPFQNGVSLKWAPVFHFEEGMHGGPLPVPPEQYEVYISEDVDNEFKKIATLDGTIQTYSVQNQLNSRTIYVKIKAIHRHLNGSESNVATTNIGQLGISDILFPNDTLNTTYGAWSGADLIYSTTDGMIIRRKDGSIRKLKKGASNPVLSPDGRYVAYVGTVNNTSYIAQLFIESLDTGEIILLDTPNTIFSVEWSHDGHSLAYVSARNIITIRSLIDGKTTWLNTPKNIGPSYQIDWTPDDQFIVFSQERIEMNNEPTSVAFNLMKMPIKGETAQPLLSSRWQDEQPAFSPNGQQIAFVSNRAGYKAIWLMDMQTGKLRQITGPDEAIYYESRLDWMSDTQLTYAANLPKSAGVSLKKVTLP